MLGCVWIYIHYSGSGAEPAKQQKCSAASRGTGAASQAANGAPDDAADARATTRPTDARTTAGANDAGATAGRCGAGPVGATRSC